MEQLNRRTAIGLLSATGLMLATGTIPSFGSQAKSMLMRQIPSSGEKIPVVGLGTWQQFDVGNSKAERQSLSEVITRMAEKGGRIIDSSPMYARSEEVIGDLTHEVKKADKFFYVTKVWTRGKQEGIEQMNASFRKMRRTTMDLMQVHNLVDWQTHLQTLRQWKEEGKVRYIGITHYIDSAHEDLEKVMRTTKLDFVQFNYSIRSRHAEKRLLNAAKDNGTAVIINQPFESGSLFNMVQGKALPAWAAELDIHSWAQYFIKFLISHPAVTCVIPGTSDPLHLVENMEAAYGKVPDEPTRKKMAEYFT